MFVVALLPMVLGVLVGWGGYLGLREKLPRDRGTGLRTPSTLRSDEAFRVANRVAGLPTVVAGTIGVLSGAAALAMPSTPGMVTAVVIGVVAMFGLVAGGGALGHRAANAVPAPAPAEPAGCSGCACGGCGAS
ncbi:SdpI/YhfL family protein [Prauserella shujinwangii]|uniref:SdpI/YhfL family protein n=1 Tax=Prauserella shujinwangii TaxID=1453103 RepID=A0A2T0LV22_9PSEU|nr:SdpI family protein [Prauserella shujinwangii]PRX47692.1 SdpI/YhfL family protein [Prauserella shujinwangii]